MEKILKHVNEKLKEYNLSLNEDEVKEEYKKLKEAWLCNFKLIKKPIKYIIIGEASVNYSNYFYNTNSNITSFLNPGHFNCATKEKLIEKFNSSGILVFDLYPLPLPTFIYDNIEFDCTIDAYTEGLNEYYGELKELIGDTQPEIVSRYGKLYSVKLKKGKEKIEQRCEWIVFINRLGVKPNQIKTINSSNMQADPEKIEDIFSRVINQID